MITFNEYAERKIYEPMIEEVAQLFIEHEVNPEAFIMDYMEKNEPEWFLYLNEQGFWGNVWGAAKDMGKAASGWFGAQKARFAGPQAKLAKIAQGVQNLINMMQNDPELQDAKTSKASRPIVQRLADTKKMLDGFAQKIPTWQQGDVSGSYTGPPTGPPSP